MSTCYSHMASLLNHRCALSKVSTLTPRGWPRETKYVQGQGRRYPEGRGKWWPWGEEECHGRLPSPALDHADRWRHLGSWHLPKLFKEQKNSMAIFYAWYWILVALLTYFISMSHPSKDWEKLRREDSWNILQHYHVCIPCTQLRSAS